jgi:hypothetical protein
MEIKSLIKNHQVKIVLIVGYLLVFGLAYGLGRLTAYRYSVPEIRVEEVFSSPLNNSQNPGINQSASVVAGSIAECQGQIKGNIGSGNSKIYHLPGGSFYDRTDPEMCFDTEAQAQAAGFRKSLR